MFRRSLCRPLGEPLSLLETKCDVLTTVLLEILISLSVSQPFCKTAANYLPVNTALHPRKLESAVEFNGRPSETKKQYSFPEESVVAACPQAAVPRATSSR